jgi:hypothetical protein
MDGTCEVYVLEVKSIDSTIFLKRSSGDDTCKR